MIKSRIAAAALPLFLIAAPMQLLAQEAQPWIHIHVTEPGEDGGTTARVNLPLTLAEIALDVVSDEIIEQGRIKLNNHDVTVEELRKMWSALKESGDAEFVSVEEDGKNVRIVREGDRILIHVDESDGEEKRVRIDVPVTLVDALLSGEGESLNLRAALNQLRGERGDIVSVDEGEKRVRIWIDESKS